MCLVPYLIKAVKTRPVAVLHHVVFVISNGTHAPSIPEGHGCCNFGDSRRRSGMVISAP